MAACYKQKLTCYQELVHFNHKQSLVAEQHRLATFVVLRRHKDAHKAHPLGVGVVVDLNGENKWSVLKVSEPVREGERYNNR